MTVSELKSTTALEIAPTARITISAEQAATLKGIYRGATSEDRLQDKDSMVICGMVSASLDKGQNYDFNNICNQIKFVVFNADDGTKYSPAMRARVSRGVMMSLVMLADPVYIITKDTRTLKNGKTQDFETFKRPNWKSFEGEKYNGEMTITGENGKNQKVVAKGHPEGEALVNVHVDTLQTVFRDLKDSDGNLLYPAKNGGGKKAKVVETLPTARTFRVECTAIRTVLQTVHTGTKVIGPDAGDVSIDDIDAVAAVIEMWDLMDEKLTRDHGSDWRVILRAAIKS